MRSISIIFFLIGTVLYPSAQPFTTDGYYLFPINPGQQNYLAGSMGELRSSHFHAGLDIKTGGQSGIPVRATADGYISRVRITSGGYGFALYMTHPNGTTSVYAHLSKFQEDIERYTLEQQYKAESFAIQLFPDKGQFTFKQGEVIAFSGNTGSSSGPHLHFEIRDENHRILDPLKFNFPEIRDNITPQMQNIAFVTLDGNARINGTYGRFEFDVIKVDGVYRTRVPISLSGNIGIEIYAYDLLDGVYNRNGISRTTLMVDGDTIFQELKSNLSFAHQRNILVHMDYAAYKNGGRKYNKLFVEDGNTNDIYTLPSRGHFFSDSTHEMSIYLEDSYGNIATFEMKANHRKVVNMPDPAMDKFEVYRNYLHLKAGHSSEPAPVLLYFQGNSQPLSPYRTDRKVAYYLWNLQDGLPDSLDMNGEILTTGIYAEIPSATALSFYNHHSDLFFRKYTLFDTLYLQFQKSFDAERGLELFDFPHGDIPINEPLKIRLKPSYTYRDSTARVYAVYGDRLNYMGGEWEDGSITFETRDWARFTIAEDTIPPVIEPRIVSSGQLYFKISDELSGISSYRATLDGDFLLMYFEPKRDLIWAVPKEENIQMQGEFILEVEDNIGNKTIYQRNLN